MAMLRPKNPVESFRYVAFRCGALGSTSLYTRHSTHAEFDALIYQLVRWTSLLGLGQSVLFSFLIG